MNGDTSPEQEYTQFIEVDPTRRYYDEILGKGASKTVYRAFDEYEGIEVAWNQVKLYDFLHNPEDIERLYREIHLLKTLNHKNIMKLYSSWADTANRNINFVTEMFASGTLRQYRLKHKRVNIRAVKHWCRQILSGLLYLHSHDLPVIHRDLKCDNIFINGNTGEVKIGDLGLAAILRKSHAVRCVGTPEFMAPEVYEEEYNELVDIYSFGMCVLEMITYEYPYSECNHPAQIYEKVTFGKKPEALYNVKDPEVRQFVEKCLATVSLRLPARELLRDPFLHFDDSCYDLIPREYQRYLDEVSPLIRQPYHGAYYSNNSSINAYTNYLGYENGDHLDYHSIEHETSEIGLFNCQQDENFEDVDIAIKGRRKDDDDIFLRLRIADKEGHIRNIYFPFDIETDTAMSVAKEMVDELDIMDQNVTKIADMIDAEIVTLVPVWKKGSSTEENQHSPSLNSCHKCGANVSLLDYVTPYNPGSKNLQVLQCSKHECATIHGRFQEITYQLEGSEQCLTEGAPNPPNQSNGMHYADIYAQKDGPDLGSQSSKSIYCHEAQHPLDLPKFGREEKTIAMDNHSDSSTRNSSLVNSSPSAHFDDYENDIRQEVRWLKAKYQMQLSELRGQQIRVKQKQSNLTPNSHLQDKEANGSSVSTSLPQVNKENRKPPQKSPSSAKYSKLRFQVDEEKKSANLSNQNVQNLETVDGSCSPEQIFTAKSFYAGNLLPNPLHRAASLPVDAIDV